MKTPVLFLTLAVIPTTLAACDPKGGDEDALIGSWTRMQTETGELRDKFSFAADGTMTFDENNPEDRAAEDHMTGTYVVSGGVITATATNARDGGRSRITFNYHVNDSVFSPEAMHPVAGHSGIVGKWERTIRFEDLGDPAQTPSGASVVFDFREDGSFQAVLTPFGDSSGPVTLGGTWVAEGAGRVRATPTPLTDAQTSDVVFHLMDGQALVPDGYVWQRN